MFPKTFRGSGLKRYKMFSFPFFEHPAIQAALAPFVVALLLGFALGRTRGAWLAPVAGYATYLALGPGLAFTPLTANRKTMLIVLAAPVLGFVADRLRRPHLAAAGLALLAGLASLWVFAKVLAQREGIALVAPAAFMAIAVATIVACTTALRRDGVRASAGGIGLGLGVGIASVLSASLGYLLAGIAIAVACGALAIVQALTRRPSSAGLLGTATLGIAAAYFAAGAFMLAEMPWYAFALMPTIPLAVLLPAPGAAVSLKRGTILVGYALAAAVLPTLAAWFATRGG